jgi:hypothetical protein
MKLLTWIKSLLFKHRRRPTPPPAALVPFYDVPSGRVVRIPPSELRPGCVQARMEGVDGVVWISPDQVEQGEIRHPPFDEDIRAYIRDIRAAFAEHRDLSFEEWEDGFRRDANPERESPSSRTPPTCTACSPRTSRPRRAAGRCTAS